MPFPPDLALSTRDAMSPQFEREYARKPVGH